MISATHRATSATEKRIDQRTAICDFDAMDSDDLRFGGIRRLLGNSGYQHLQSATAMVVGVGGVGSWTAEALARTGLGHLILVDLDDVCISNTNRQLHALSSTVGKQKSMYLRPAASIFPQQLNTTEHTFATAKTIEELSSLNQMWLSMPSINQQTNIFSSTDATGKH